MGFSFQFEREKGTESEGVVLFVPRTSIKQKSRVESTQNVNREIDLVLPFWFGSREPMQRWGEEVGWVLYLFIIYLQRKGWKIVNMVSDIICQANKIDKDKFVSLHEHVSNVIVNVKSFLCMIFKCSMSSETCLTSKIPSSMGKQSRCFTLRKLSGPSDKLWV